LNNKINHRAVTTINMKDTQKQLGNSRYVVVMDYGAKVESSKQLSH